MASTKTGINYQRELSSNSDSVKNTIIPIQGDGTESCETPKQFQGKEKIKACNIVVCGGGIIGTATAYFLTQKGAKVTVIERCHIACAASGKSGGFLAYDWNDKGPLEQLTRKSFDLHATLGKEFGNTDYRRMDTLSLSASESKTSTSKRSAKNAPDWVDGVVHGSSILGDTNTTAQVHPEKLCKAFIEAAVAKGSTVKIGTVQGFELSPNKDQIIGVKVDGDIIPADVVVIAMGPWSGKAAAWLKGVPNIRGQRAHSITMKPKVDISAHALFLNCQFSGEHFDPEVYPRPDGEVYMCGMSDSSKLPDDPATIKPNENSCKKLKDIAGQISSHLNDATIEKMQACYLPVTPLGIPCIGRISDIKGAYIAAGHSCWGILNGPATGAAIAELIIDGKSSIVDLTPFDPARFCF